MGKDWESLSRSEKKEEAQKTLKMLENEKPLYPQQFSQWTTGQKVWTLGWGIGYPLVVGIVFGWGVGVSMFVVSWIVNYILAKISIVLIARYLLNKTGHTISKILVWAQPPLVYMGIYEIMLQYGYIVYPTW